MASVTVTIPSSPSEIGSAAIGWQSVSGSSNLGISLGSSLSASGNEIFLGRLSLLFSGSGNTIFLRLALDATSDPLLTGPDFSDQMEASGTIRIVASNGSEVTVLGILDATEPYIWEPSNAADVRSFANTVRGLTNRSLVLTFNDNANVAPSFADDTGDAQSWTQNTAIASITVPEATGTPGPTYAVVGSLPAGVSFSTSSRVISGTPTATGSGTITIRATNSEGSDDWTVAYTTAAPPATVPSAPTGFTATVTHNSVSLTWADPGDASITSYQILRRDITGGGSLGVHIDSVPAGTSYVDTTNVEPENTYSYRIKARNAQGLSAQSGFRNVTTSAVPSVDHAVDAVAVAWTFGLPEPTVSHTTGHAVDAEVVAWVFDLPEPTVTHTPRVTTDHAVDAGGRGLDLRPA